MVTPVAVRRLKQSPPENWNFSSNVAQPAENGLVPVRAGTLFCSSLLLVLSGRIGDGWPGLAC